MISDKHDLPTRYHSKPKGDIYNKSFVHLVQYIALFFSEMVPPSKPEVTVRSDTSVLVEWTMSDNSGLPITFFKVQYKEMVDDSNRRRWRTIDDDIPADMLHYEVTDLKPGKSIYIQ